MVDSDARDPTVAFGPAQDGADSAFDDQSALDDDNSFLQNRAMDGAGAEFTDSRAGLTLANLPVPQHWMRALFGVRALLLLQRNVACLRLVRCAPSMCWL